MMSPTQKPDSPGRVRAAVRPATRPGFTLIELLVVIIVLAILIGLLLPVINGAFNTAKQAAVQAEINSIAQALASFKTTYGDYPPSRVYLAENGFYPTSNTTVIATGDITLGALAQRSLIALRKFFPRVVFSTTGVPPQIANNNNFWYDFNGNGKLDGPNGYILEGHECLVFFLGGIPSADPATHLNGVSSASTFGMVGFGKDPTNPFTNNLASDPNFANAPNPMYSGNRQPPMYEFNAGRLFIDPANVSDNGLNPGIPGYYDSLNNAPPGIGGSTAINFYVYFSAYGGVYDPNDVNFLSEADGNLVSPIGLAYQYGTTQFISPAPNPYTTTATVTTTGSVTFEKAQTFQLFSAGRDGLYGVGGQYVAPSTAASTASNQLPLDSAHTYSGATLTGDTTIRLRERDNLTNFQSGTLE
jgi:prepilin-type N-terminal cleavage/methylation domain-containing protein